MSRWYRAYEGTVTDAKLGEVALVCQCSRSVAIAAWHAILESAASVNDGGRFNITPRRIAAVLSEAPSLIEQVFFELKQLGMIADGCVTAWKRRQYDSDTSTERSRKYRERQRNASATLQDRCATPPETETETDMPLSECAGESASVPQATTLRTRIVAELYGGGLNAPIDIARADTWVAQGWDPEICFSVMAEALTRPGARDKPLKWFDRRIQEAHDNRNTKPHDPAAHHHVSRRTSRSEQSRAAMAEALARRPDSRLAAQASGEVGTGRTPEGACGAEVIRLERQTGSGFG